jgi:hypothetical protein
MFQQQRANSSLGIHMSVNERGQTILPFAFAWGGLAKTQALVARANTWRRITPPLWRAGTQILHAGRFAKSRRLRAPPKRISGYLFIVLNAALLPTEMKRWPSLRFATLCIG